MKNIRRIRKKAREQAQLRFKKQKRYNYKAAPGDFDFIIVLDNLKPTFNIGKIFRTADAFGTRAVHLIGIDFFDPTPAKGSFKWVPAFFHDTFADCYQNLQQQGYTIYALEPEAGEPLQLMDLPGRSAFLFGHEEFGFSFDKELYPDIQNLRIAQFGKVQSLNVSIAASVVMFEYTRQHASPEMLARIPQQGLTGRE